MSESKPWYLSRTVWASLATVILALAGLLRLPVEGMESGALAEALLQLATGIAGVVAILGRLSARERIG